MIRYRGENLPVGCRIAVVANDALGNFVVATPLMQMLRVKFRPSALHFYSGRKTQEIWSQSTFIDSGFVVDPENVSTAIEGSFEDYDLIFNMESADWAKRLTCLLAGERSAICGPCFKNDSDKQLPFDTSQEGLLASDLNWLDPNLRLRYPFLESHYISEILCRIAHLSGTVPKPEVISHAPNLEVPDVLISTSASLEEKLWPVEGWLTLTQRLRDRGYSVGVIGAGPEDQKRYWFGAASEDAILMNGLAVDLRGKLTLPQVAGALSVAKLCVSLDNGVLHVATSVGTPSVGLYRFGFDRLWAQPAADLAPLAANKGTTVSSIETWRVLDAVERSVD